MERMEGKRVEGNVGEKNLREGRRYGLGIMNGKRNWREWREKELERRKRKQNRKGKSKEQVKDIRNHRRCSWHF